HFIFLELGALTSKLRSFEKVIAFQAVFLRALDVPWVTDPGWRGEGAELEKG
ncbi:hypothetical protein MUG91_G19n66, partial [Manis pentadactyla]